MSRKNIIVGYWVSFVNLDRVRNRIVDVKKNFQANLARTEADQVLQTGFDKHKQPSFRRIVNFSTISGKKVSINHNQAYSFRFSV